MDKYVICGMQFGDEGKGSFVDFLVYSKQADCVARYNGGPQAPHTVVTPSNVTNRFTQLSSGTFLEKCHTVLTENTVVDLHNLLIEINMFSAKTGIPVSTIIKKIHISEECYVVTPYHKLINKLREFSKGKKRKGTAGTGVSEVMYLLKKHGLGIQVKDIYDCTEDSIVEKMEVIQRYVHKFYKANKNAIWSHVPDEMKSDLQKEIAILLEPSSYIKIAFAFIDTFTNAPQETNFSNYMYSSYNFSRETVIFEGSQGLLLDREYGIKPNTTWLDTTCHYASNLLSSDSIRIGIAKAYISRHGMGVFPTESFEVSDKVSDSSQAETYWNGKMRFGWFDAILLRYAQKVNRVDELYLSSLDKLDSFEEIMICNQYIYGGVVDKSFEEIFKYYVSPSGEIIITDIKKNDPKLSNYLKECTPRYIINKGWLEDTTKVSKASELPTNCLQYIKLLEKLIDIPITVVSVGPTRKNKIFIKDGA